MNVKWKITILITLLSVGLLTACNTEKRESLNQENDVNFRPVRYERKPNSNESNNDYKNQDDRLDVQDETPEKKDQKRR
ncbi:hypothetical protein ACIQAA_23410 [Neobacillus sp. NPDC093182]|uniref:hypothetical protein n=1 Tax=Neobacillus sp. NPDC093182 TaxID=3364297 RepID=UPI003818E11A